MTERWIIESLLLLVIHLGVTLPPLPPAFTALFTSGAGVEEESGDDSEEIKSDHDDSPALGAYFHLRPKTMPLEFYF